MIKLTVLDVQVARDIVRKAGVIGGDQGSLEDQLLSPPPSDSHPARPRRRVQNDLLWPYAGYAGTPDGDTYWDEGVSNFSLEPVFDRTLHIDSTVGSQHTPWYDIGRLADSQVRFNAMHFVGFSDNKLPVGGYVTPHAPDFGEATGSGVIRAGRAWVGGQTVYDPFPCEGYYLYADTKEAYVTPVIGQFFAGNGPTPYEEFSGSAASKIILKTWASSDGGTTWDAPWPPVAVPGGTNAGSAYWARWVGGAVAPTALQDGYIHPPATTLKDEFRADDTLFKFTLTFDDPGDWFQFHLLGLHVLGFKPINLAITEPFL